MKTNFTETIKIDGQSFTIYNVSIEGQTIKVGSFELFQQIEICLKDKKYYEFIAEADGERFRVCDIDAMFLYIFKNEEIKNPSEKDIVDDIMEEYIADKKILGRRSFPKQSEPKRDLFTDVLMNISLQVGWERIEFENSTRRNDIISQWTEEFVSLHSKTDWEENDYFNLVDEFAKKKIETYLKNHSRKQYSVKYVLGTEAVREYSNCVDNGEKWNDSSLCDCGLVSIGKFNTPEELAAYKQGIDDASGYLEAEEMMTDEEWEEYLKEYGKKDDEEDD